MRSGSVAVVVRGVETVRAFVMSRRYDGLEFRCSAAGQQSAMTNVRTSNRLRESVHITVKGTNEQASARTALGCDRRERRGQAGGCSVVRPSRRGSRAPG